MFIASLIVDVVRALVGRLFGLRMSTFVGSFARRIGDTLIGILACTFACTFVGKLIVTLVVISVISSSL